MPRVARAFSHQRRDALAPLLLLVCMLLSRGATHAAGRPPARREGDVLRIFDNNRVYVITNDDAALADTLLEDAHQKERRILTVGEWRDLPPGIRRYVSTVFLINREQLPAAEIVPEKCPADSDEVYTEVVRSGFENGVTYQVIISAPDGAWLRQGIASFRRLTEPPRGAQKQNVRSLAVIPVGAAAVTAASPLLSSAGEGASFRAHLLPAEQFDRAAPRVADMDELYLVDRSAAPPSAFAPTLDGILTGRSIGKSDTVAWRERKPSGRSRIIFCAPTADQLAEAIRRYPDPLNVPETAIVVNTARDLRSIRRVAVVGIRTGAGGDSALARRMAASAATELRALDAFEVLERSGLSAVLGEVALDQAGITRAKDRARVRQLAAADALLLVEITGIDGRTEYSATQKRVTPWLAGPPRRPSEPSRLRVNLGITDPTLQKIADGALARALGTKSDREYQRELARYNNETLPRWQREVDDYNDERRTRAVTWEQRVTAHSSATLTGSLRLVDLTDGLVLWEAPFTATERDESPSGVNSVTTTGEDSRPDQAGDVQEATANVPDTLLDRAAETALAQGIRDLRGTALLPTPASFGSSVAGTPDTDPLLTVGRLLDVDGNTLLIGLGASDGLKVGDGLLVTLADGQKVRVVATRVRPRTCDAVFDRSIPAATRARCAVGQSAAKE